MMNHDEPGSFQLTKSYETYAMIIHDLGKVGHRSARGTFMIGILIWLLELSLL